MPSNEKPRKKTQSQLLIEALVENALQEPGAPAVINWQLEMKFLRELLKKHGDVDFWFWFGRKRKYATLKHLLATFNDTNVVQAAIIDYTKQTKLDFKSPPTVKLEEKKIGEDIIIPQKPKTLLDFINNV